MDLNGWTLLHRNKAIFENKSMTRGRVKIFEIAAFVAPLTLDRSANVLGIFEYERKHRRDRLCRKCFVRKDRKKTFKKRMYLISKFSKHIRRAAKLVRLVHGQSKSKISIM